MNVGKAIDSILAAILIVVLISTNVFAQTTGKIEGSVVDAQTGKALIGAKVALHGTKLSARAGEDGKYLISDVPAGKYEIIATIKDYEKATKEVDVSADAVTTVNFQLETITLELREVKIRKGRITEIDRIRHSPMAVTVIDAKEFRGRDVTLNEILNKATGVKIRQAGGLGSEDRIAIHGMEGKRVKVFIDESPINTPDGSFGINDLPIQLIERIEIYKGVVPARLGGDTLGGAVNVVMREYNSDYVDTTYSLGGNNTHRATWVFAKMLPETGIEFGTGGFFNYADNDYTMESPFQPGLMIKRDHDAYLSYGGALVLKLKKAWFDEIEFALETYGNRKEIQGVQRNIRFAETRSAIYVAEMEMGKEGFFHDNLDFDYSVGVPVLVGRFIDTSYYRYDWDGTKYPSPNGQGEVGWDPHDSRDKEYRVGQRLNLNYRINDTHNLNLNNVTRYVSRHPDDPLASEHAGYNVSEFPSDMYSAVTGLTHETSLFGDKMVNSLGIKLFHISSEIAATGMMQRSLHGTPKTVENSMTKFGISEAFQHWVHPSLNVKASCEHAVRLPNSNELFGDGVMITPSPWLDPEVSENANVGAMFQKYDVLRMPKLEAEINGFLRHTHDMIKLEGNSITTGYVNLGAVRTLGVDGEIRADLNRYIYGYANATYQDLRDVRDYVAGTQTPNPTKDLRVPNIPWFYCNFGVELHKENLFRPGIFGKIFWESSYVEEFFYAWEMSKYQRRRIPSCFRQTAGIEFSFNNGMILSAEIHNLTDVKVLDIYNRPRPGRTFHINLRYSWFREEIGEKKRRAF